jgi:hypothetical protein
VHLLDTALGPQGRGAPAAPIVAPLRKATNRLSKAVRRATRSPSRRAGQRLRQAAAGVSSAAQQIGVPECAIAST